MSQPGSRGQFALHGATGATIPTAMKIPALFAPILILSLASCKKEKVVTVTETRPLTTKDQAPKLFASSDERFRDTRPSPVKGTTPEGWLALPATQMRLLNYRFGESGLGEVWVSISSGSVLDNVNRWLGQFDAPKLDGAGLQGLRKASIGQLQGVWVEADGDYAGGMGAPARTGYSLAGVVADRNGSIYTVKMVGPKEDVANAKAALEVFSRSLTLAE